MRTKGCALFDTSKILIREWGMVVKIVFSEKRLCSCCMKNHHVKVVEVKDKYPFNGLEVDYIAQYYYCDIAETLYVDEELWSINDVRIKEAYQKKAYSVS